MKNNKKIVSKTLLTMLFAFGFFIISIVDVDAATQVGNTNPFNLSVGPFGNYAHDCNFQGNTANYLKVTINTSGGDKYDLRYVGYAGSWASKKVLATKTGLSAGGTTSVVYFIPTGGSCPGSVCVTVPTLSGYVSSSNVDNAAGKLFGIQIYNGSWLGGTLHASGTYKFYNY